MQNNGLRAVVLTCLFFSPYLWAHEPELPYGCSLTFENMIAAKPRLDLAMPHMNKPVKISVPGGREVFWMGYDKLGAGELKAAAALIAASPVVGLLHHGVLQPLQLAYYAKSTYEHRQLISELTPYTHLFSYLYDSPSAPTDSKEHGKEYFQALHEEFSHLSGEMLRAYLIAGDQNYLFCPSGRDHVYMPPEEIFRLGDFPSVYYEQFYRLVDSYPYILHPEEVAYEPSPELTTLVDRLITLTDVPDAWERQRYRTQALSYLKTGECRSKENYAAPVQMRKILENGLRDRDPYLRYKAPAWKVELERNRPSEAR